MLNKNILLSYVFQISESPVSNYVMKNVIHYVINNKKNNDKLIYNLLWILENDSINFPDNTRV